MFKKLNINFLVENYTYGDKIVEYGSLVKNNTFLPKIAYHGANGQCKVLLEKLIPKQYHDGFKVAIMDINAQVGPHTDSEILVTINHYIQTNDEVTTFYSFKDNIEIVEGKARNQTNGSVFNLLHLVTYGSYTAKENETWILDVTKPHSVKSTINTDRVYKLS